MAEMNVAASSANPAVRVPVMQGRLDLDMLLRPEIHFEPASRRSHAPYQFEELEKAEKDVGRAVREKVEQSRQVILKGYMVPRKIQLDIFEETGDFYAKVVNADTGDLLRTLPPMALLEARARIEHYLGMLLDEYA